MIHNSSLTLYRASVHVLSETSLFSCHPFKTTASFKPTFFWLAPCKQKVREADRVGLTCSSCPRWPIKITQIQENERIGNRWEHSYTPTLREAKLDRRQRRAARMKQEGVRTKTGRQEKLDQNTKKYRWRRSQTWKHRGGRNKQNNTNPNETRSRWRWELKPENIHIKRQEYRTGLTRENVNKNTKRR